MPKEDADQLSPEEAARRRDDALRRALAMPPKPQEAMKLGKPRGRGRKARPGAAESAQSQT